MRFRAAFTGLVTLASVIAAAPVGDTDPEVAAAQRIIDLQAIYHKQIFTDIADRQMGCSVKNIQIRKEWSTLCDEDKAAFIAAVGCLNSLPAETPLERAAGAHTRYDDFVVAHIEQTPLVHASGLFLPFHRYFLHLYEQDLRTKCAYTGPFPYWDWSLSYQDPRNASVFDGTDLSLGGNGVYIPDRPATNISLPGGFTLTIPPATGGGCVESGPFTPDKFEVRLGPVAYEPVGPDGGLGYNPRCLTRDLSPEFSKQTRPSRVLKLIDECKDLACVNEQMDIPDGVPGGVHAAGHWQVGLEALDIYASPSDPVFYLHHAQIDRVWTIWQGQKPAERNMMVWGTGTAVNDPPSPNVTLDSIVEFGILAPPKSIRQLVSTIDGEFCYVYN
ncbi:Di-copper centre-containing protein [Parathielavia appendiculata]|uniref:Di-copper centre-containing protein n=1 Tax=Parathielavia appendiculata TaxID=2587402 RepID=A0AAN6TTY7_9PEZI|nr:Di-copper centre-containing protein [Parathielavia appendiculata]